jgi:hypothetical protein
VRSPSDSRLKELNQHSGHNFFGLILNLTLYH